MEKEDLDIEYYVKKLHFITSKLRAIALLISLILVFNIIALITFVSLNHKPLYSSREDNSSVYLFVLFFPILGVVTLFFFNILRKQGMTYYEEVTDEISWGKNREEYQQRPPIKFRVTIKDFLKSTDLPFTSGPNGQAIYLAFFFLMIITSILLKENLVNNYT